MLLLAAPLVMALDVDCRFADREIEIDGVLDEWQGAMSWIDEESGVAVGLLNDSDYLYVAFSSRDSDVNRQAMMLGLELWLDPKGDAPSFGIRFPVGAFKAGQSPRDFRGRNRDEMQRTLEATLDRLEILGPGADDAKAVDLGDLHGIEVGVVTAGKFAYELKLPLRQSDSHPDALGAAPGDKLALRLETGDMEAMREQMRGSSGMGRGGGMSGGSGGGMGRGGGTGRGMGGGRGGPGGGARQSRPEPLKVKAKIQLASAAE